MAGKNSTIKLSIIYETSAAAQAVADLDAKVDALIKRKNKAQSAADAMRAKLGLLGTETAATSKAVGTGTVNMRTMANAGAQLAQSLATGSVSAGTLTSSISQLGVRLGAAGIVLAVGAAALALFKRNSDKASEAAYKFEKQLRQTTRRVDDLLRVDRKSPLQGEIDNITEAIRDLDRELAKQRKSVFERLFGGLTFPNIGRFVFGGEDPQTREQRDALAGQRGRLTPEAEREAERGRFGQARGLSNAMNRLLDVDQIERLDGGLDAMRQHLENLIAMGLDPFSDEAQQMAASIRQGEGELRKLTRSADTMRTGLETVADRKSVV